MSGKFLQSAVGRGLREAGAALKQEGAAEVSKKNAPILMMCCEFCLVVLTCVSLNYLSSRSFLGTDQI